MTNPMMERYTRQTTQAGGGGRRFDVKAEVVDYNLDGKTVNVKLSEGSAPVKAGYPAELSVSISTYAPKGSRPDADFEGNVVDGRMAAQIPPQDTVILEGLTLPGEPAQVKSGHQATVRWINSAPGANPEKVVEGIFTASGIAKTSADGDRSYEVTHVQQWAARGMCAEDFFTDKMKASFDETLARYAKRAEDPKADTPVKPNTGVAFRAIVEQTVVDYIPPVSYNRNEKRPVSFEDIQQGYEEYKAHVEATYGAGTSVEIVPVREYPVAPSSRDQLAASPAGTMVRTSAPLTTETDAPSIGNQSYAVQGTLALSPGKLNPRDGTRKGAHHDWVTHTYFSARKAHIHDMVPDEMANIVAVDDRIREKMAYPSRDQGVNAPVAETTPESGPAPVADASTEVDEDALLDEGFEATTPKAHSGPSMG